MQSIIQYTELKVRSLNVFLKKLNTEKAAIVLCFEM